MPRHSTGGRPRRSAPSKARKPPTRDTVRPTDRKQNLRVTHLALSPRATNVVLKAMREYKKNLLPEDDDRDIFVAVIRELEGY